MVEGGELRNWGARVVAPVVFFAAVTLLVLLVRSSLDDDAPSTSPPAVTQPAAGVGTTEADTGSAETGTGTSTATEPLRKEFYRVKSGDTLESISARFDTTVADLLALNPNIDPLALQTGQRVRVR